MSKERDHSRRKGALSASSFHGKSEFYLSPAALCSCEMLEQIRWAFQCPPFSPCFLGH